MNLIEDECAVKIVVRERPLPTVYQNNEVSSAIDYHSNSNIIIVDDRPFAFDHVLSPIVSQLELFDFLVMPLIGKVLKGFNCTALAYGQTGTGKSFTMGLNPESLEGPNMGMIPRCVQTILDNSQNKEHNSEVKQEISASFIEIYSEKVYDLLSENPAEPIIARGYKFTGGTKKPISTIQDGYALLNQGTKNRHVRPTKMNPQSSRSHAIFTIYVRNEVADKITQSCLNLVDLAGSEGVRRTGHQGVALSEGVHINQGLLSIGKVLQAITHGYKVIPYRDSVLSSVLQDSLNPNSYFTLLACISPHREDLSETLSTLRFAQSAKNLKHNPQINSKLMELKKSKTPFKANPLRPKNSLVTPTPYKRPFSLINTKQSSGLKNPSVHGNTFSTPNKKRKTEVIKLNNTNVGLTPKEKQKIGSVRMTTAKTNLFSFEPSIRESMNDAYNDLSLDSRASLLSLNISSSTAIEAQSTKPSTFSPMVRKCMAGMENMLRVLETLKVSQRTETTATAFTPSEPSPLSLVDQKIRNIVRQELLSITGNKTKIDDPLDIENNVRCELFRASSPIFKIPEIPGVRPLSSFNASQSSNLTQNENFLGADETVLSAKPLRRSRRLSVRRSLSTDESLAVPRRRSTRLSSIKTLNEGRRQSIRLAARKEKSFQEEDEEMVVKEEKEKEEKLTSSSNRSKQAKRPTKKKPSALVNNSVIAGYFNEDKEKKPTNTKNALAKHQKAILEMLNSASMKELQYLPQVGLKTAFQIVTQRTLHGKFKNFTQVGKLPIWRGKAWDRFKEANNIS